jgi:hypothetical protein
MKHINIICGSHSRHIWIVKNVISAFKDYSFKVLCMRRDDVDPLLKFTEHPLRELIGNHFSERNHWEQHYFGVNSVDELLGYQNVCLKIIDSSALNSIPSKEWIYQDGCLTLTIGCLILDTAFLEIISPNTLNFHIGLSPWYKGSATLFWPNYNLEPDYSGLTFHRLSPLTDGGGIIHQVVIEGEHDEHFQRNSVRLVYQSIPEYLDTIRYCSAYPNDPGIELTTPGRLYLIKAWRPEHLLPLYSLTGGYVYQFLRDRKLSSPKPRIYTRFDRPGLVAELGL